MPVGNTESARDFLKVTILLRTFTGWRAAQPSAMHASKNKEDPYPTLCLTLQALHSHHTRRAKSIQKGVTSCTQCHKSTCLKHGQSPKDFLKMAYGTGDMTQWVKCLLHRRKNQNLDPKSPHFEAGHGNASL